MEPTKRRLSAILVADVVGYSRLIERDETGTLASMRTLIAGTITSTLAKYGGRLVKQMGDGFIAEFGSVVGAVNRAVEVQRGAESEQSERPAEHRLIFRIGINLGDVVVEGEDLLGDGIIVASRLEALCEPGGVLVSGTAFDQLQGKVEAPVEFVATRRVKNIARPVRTYRVRLDGKRSLWPRLRLQSPAANYVLGALAILAVGAAAFWWWTSEDMTSAKPGIAVLPFEDLTGDASTARLSNGLTEDIITDLARYRGFDVIASNSVERYIAPVDIRSVGKALNVNYVLQGSVQKQDEHLRVSAKLVNAQSGAVTWSERWDRPIGDFFAVQSELSGQVATRLGGLSGTVLAVDREVSRRKPPNNLTAYDLYLLALDAQGRAT
jgi:TolB-like protein/class 3 adenylate cyclase